MNQQPDKLFREKLENFQIPTPASAWERIDRNVNKKNSASLFLKVAASLLLIMAATAIFWSSRKGEPRTIAKSPEQTNVSPVQKDTQPLVSEPDVEKGIIVPKEKKALVEGTKGSEYQDAVQKPKSINEDILLATSEPTLPLVEWHEPVTIPPLASADAGEDRGVTLRYTAEEVNQKNLDKKALAEATSRDKSTSTLEKLLDKAYDLKHNQDPFGTLRQKKNEILALNFRSDKQRSQNK